MIASPSLFAMFARVLPLLPPGRVLPGAGSAFSTLLAPSVAPKAALRAQAFAFERFGLFGRHGDAAISGDARSVASAPMSRLPSQRGHPEGHGGVPMPVLALPAAAAPGTGLAAKDPVVRQDLPGLKNVCSASSSAAGQPMPLARATVLSGSTMETAPLPVRRSVGKPATDVLLHDVPQGRAVATAREPVQTPVSVVLTEAGGVLEIIVGVAEQSAAAHVRLRRQLAIVLASSGVSGARLTMNGASEILATRSGGPYGNRRD